MTSDKIGRMQLWADEKFNGGKIGWLGVFNDLETANEYKNKFFNTSDKSIKTLAVFFNEKERESFLKEFEPESESESYNGLGENLLKKIEETPSAKTLGYDLVGVEYSGELHTFYCHDMAKELKDKFCLRINEYGLIEDCENWNNLVEYMNNEETGCEPVPWFYVKVKMIE